jgi:ADP-ribosylglycohydrolase
MERSLDGLSMGDAFGERFFSWDDPPEQLVQVRRRELPVGPCRYTDDTEMALSIVEMLRERGIIDQNRLATAFACRYRPERGYGAGAHQLLEQIGRSPTGAWQCLAPAMFGGRGSFGNGAAMRVAPLGAYFADDYAEAARQAALSAQVTHTHAEGISGAVAVAVAAAWMAREQPWDRDAFFDTVLEHTREGETRLGLTRARQLPHDRTGSEAARLLGSGDRVTAQDTVPFAIWCAACQPHDFVETFWRTLEGLGDRDTTCAIACGIIGARTPPPQEWVDNREALPWDFPGRGERNLIRTTRSWWSLK